MNNIKLKTVTLSEMKDIIKNNGRIVYKKHNKNGNPIYFITIDDKPKSKMQYKLNQSDIYKANCLNVQ